MSEVREVQVDPAPHEMRSGVDRTGQVGPRWRFAMNPSPAALELAHALLNGPWKARPMVDRAAEVLGERPLWLRMAVLAVLRKFRHAPPLGEPTILALVLDAYAGVRRARVRRAALVPAEMSPVRGPWSGAPFPLLPTIGDVATWLGVDIRSLVWMAEPWRQRKAFGTPRALYTLRWIQKRRGERRPLEIPRPRLRAIQRRILDEILALMPVHEAAHGFVRGRGVGSFAAPHVGQRCVLALDLTTFFTSVPRAGVFRVFRAAGYPETVSRLLAGLCTHAAPIAGPLGAPHLPQGAPTSPALANLCAFRLDMRLHALAKKAGATYTRYADDLAFSGDETFARAARRFTAQVASIALEEGFAINHRKSRRMRGCDRQLLAGVVVNQRVGVARADVDALEAALFNCVRRGPAAENRDGHTDYRSHLLGRIGWVGQHRPERAAQLRELFDRISWT